MSDERKRLARPPTSGTRKGNGMGWGGASSGMPASGSTGDKPALHPTSPGELTESEAALAAEARSIYVRTMRNEKQPMLALMAAEKLLDRLEGKPIARNVNLDVTPHAKLTDDELSAEQARVAHTLAGTEPGAAEAGGKDGPEDLVH